MGLRGTDLVVCEHKIVPQDCPYCELKRLRDQLKRFDSRLIVNAYIDGAAVGNHGDVQKRADAYARDILATPRRSSDG
jgi:hypothetical protein